MKDLIPEEHRSHTLSNIVVVAFGILMLAVAFYFKDLYRHFMNILNAGLPFFIGIAFALLELPMMRFFERQLRFLLCRRREHPKLCRGIAAFLSMLVLLGVIVAFFAILLPQLIRSVQTLVNVITRFVQENNDVVMAFLREHGLVTFDGNMAWENILNEATNYVTVVINSAKAISTSIYHIVFQIMIGFIASLYLVSDNERFCAIARKSTYALFRKETADWLVYWTRQASKIFSGFISGKVIDSLIVGVICYICMTIFGMSYSMLISVIVAITNLIPFFGPFIGAVPSTLILAIIDPIQAIWFMIFIIVLQQVDGNIIGPLILGDQVGLPAFWIMVSIVGGGALFGFAGMLLGVPVMALIYAMADTFISDRLEKKGMASDTESYILSYDKKRPGPLAGMFGKRNREKEKE